MNSKGFAFFRWRVLCHPYVGDNSAWWDYWGSFDFYTWKKLNPEVTQS